MFTTKIGILDTPVGNSLVIMLGDCRIAETIQAERVVRFPDATNQTIKMIGSIDLREFKDGITLLVAENLVESDHELVRRIQKYLVFCYVKFVWFAKQNTSTPDPLNLGGNKGPLADLGYRINAVENLSYLLTSPRAKNLVGAMPSLPVLILAPGPSLQIIAPHIKELSERFLVICLSRTLAFCRDNDVVPDIVVQLDTHGEQQNFYPDDVDYSASWLLALSCAHVKKYIHRFAGVFWIDTFEGKVYGDAYEIRNSWLSSLIPMLGAAELMKPSLLLVAGADLAYDKPVAGGASTLSDADEIVGVCEGVFGVRLNDGSVGSSMLQFMATAYEAETIASELALSMQTLVFSITPSGILDPDIFAMAQPEDFLKVPPVNRRLFHGMMKQAVRSGDLPDPKAMKRVLQEQLREAENLARKANVVANMDGDTIRADNPLLSASKLVSFLHPLPDVATQLHMSLKHIEKHRDLLRRRIIEFRLADWADRGKEVAVLCYPDEVAGIESSLNARFPNGRWVFRHTWAKDMAPVANPLVVRDVPQFLYDRPVTLISTKYAEAADYLLSMLPLDKVLMVEQLLSEPRMPSV